MWRQHELKDEYDVVIIGGGVHGLSIAYYLGKRGVTNVAVLDRAYLGGGASARTTAIIRANYITPQGIPFFQHGLKLYEGLSQELNFNILFTQMGRLDLGHTESAVYGLRIRADFNKLLGVDSTIIGPSEVKKLVPAIDLREGKTLPIMAALYHPSAGVLRHDAVVWGYARGADKLGAELHPQTDVLGIDTENGQVTGVNTSRGPHQDEDGGQHHGWLGLHHRADGGRGPANRDPPAGGVRHGATEAVYRQDRVVGQPPHLRLPDRPWRGGDGVARWTRIPRTANARRWRRWRRWRPTAWRCSRACARSDCCGSGRACAI